MFVILQVNVQTQCLNAVTVNVYHSGGTVMAKPIVRTEVTKKIAKQKVWQNHIPFKNKKAE